MDIYYSHINLVRNYHNSFSWLMSISIICLLLLVSMVFSKEVVAWTNPGWGNAALVCDSPRIGGDSPKLNFKGTKPSFKTGFYHIGRLPDPEDRFLGVADNDSGTVVLLPSATHAPTKWLITQVGADLYQVSTCHNGEPRCLVLPDGTDVRVARIEQCEFEARGSQVWWNIGILLGPGKGGWVLGNDNASRMDCLLDSSGVPVLAACDTSGKPDATWRVEPVKQVETGSISKDSLSTSKKVKSLPAFPKDANVISYQCESGQTVEASFDFDRDQMQVRYQDQILKLDPIISGSGAKFGGPNLPWGWWTKGEQGSLFSYAADGTEGGFIENCREVEAIQNMAYSSDQNPEPTIDPNREWMNSGAYEEIVLMDCQNCGDDIGIMVECQGAANPALVSLNWAATESPSPASFLTIEIDGQTFERGVSTVNNGMLGQVPQFYLQRNDPLIAALQKGSVAKIKYGDVRTQIGLRGSKDAFAIFNAHCGWNQPIEKSTQSSLPETTNTTGEPILGTPVPHNPDVAIWYASEYFDDQKNRAINNLIFGIPETDAFSLIATCDTNTSTAEIDLSLDTGTQKAGAPFYVRLQTGDFDQTYQGQVFSDSSEYSGVKLVLPKEDVFWKVLSKGEKLYIVPHSGRELELEHSASISAVETWLKQCNK